MSVSFWIDGIEEEDGSEFPCENCGRRIGDPGPVTDCQLCYGWGGPSNFPPPRFRLHMSATNARALLQYLGVPFGGHRIEPALLLEKLTEFPPHGFVAPNQKRHGVMVMGRTLDQVWSYWRSLTRIARKAKQYKRNVRWSE